MLYNRIFKYFFSKKSIEKKKPNSFLIQKEILGEPNNVLLVDVGAHTGESIVEYQKLFTKLSIISFEPFKESFKELSVRYGNNRNIKLVNKAVANHNGKIPFYFNDSSATNSILKSNQTNSYIDQYTKNLGSTEVDVITLDSYTQNNDLDQIDILKLDIQGAELFALEGAERLLRNQNIKLIYTEVEFIHIYNNQPLFQDIANYLAKFNYFPQGFYNFHHQKNHQLAWCDVIFIPTYHLSK